MKKFLSVLCAVAIAFCCMTYTAFAENTNDNGSISTYSLVFNTNESDLKVSGKIATCVSEVKISSNDAMIYVIQTLQKQSGSEWTNTKIASQMFDSNKAKFTKIYTSLSSGTYRVKTDVVVYLGSNAENTTSYSIKKTI